VTRLTSVEEAEYNVTQPMRRERDSRTLFDRVAGSVRPDRALDRFSDLPVSDEELDEMGL
jgi:hypothetical protein